MNGKPNFPPIAPFVIIGVVVLTIKALFFSDEKEMESAPAAPQRPPPPIPPDSGGNSTENRGFPPNSSGKLTAPLLPAVTPAYTAPPPLTIPAIIRAAQAPLSATKRKLIMREDMAAVFHRGARKLTRKDAVAALIDLGFGKSASYEALLEDGRFAFWLQFTPDGIITWKD